MTWNNTDEPTQAATKDLRAILEDYATTSERLLEALQTSAASGEATNWRPHFLQMHAAISNFASLCRHELATLDRAHESDLEPDDVHELVWEQGERLVRWLRRMLAE